MEKAVQHCHNVIVAIVKLKKEKDTVWEDDIPSIDSASIQNLKIHCPKCIF